MITPIFWLEQDDTYVYVFIKCPLMRAQDLEYTIDSKEFYFYCRPYFLRLTFANRLVQDGREQGSYDADTGLLKFRMPKETPGQHFPDLELLPTLLAPPKATEPSIAKPLVQEADDESADTSSDAAGPRKDHKSEREPLDIAFSQEVALDTLAVISRYGFASLYSGYFRSVPEDLEGELLDIPNPDVIPLTPAMADVCRLTEEAAFDEDRYMFDFLDLDGAIKRLLTMPGPFEDVASVVFSDVDIELMSALVPKDFQSLDDVAIEAVYLLLMDILLAYCYDHRLTEGHCTIESPWTISKLAAGLCCLRTFASLEDVVSSFMRRSLCFPLYRNSKLTLQAMQDAARILINGGKRILMKIFITLKRIFDADELRYIFCKLFFNDFCVWLGKASNERLVTFGNQLQSLTNDLPLLPWPLQQYEALALEDLHNEPSKAEALA